jgi:hypothetical protein
LLAQIAPHHGIIGEEFGRKRDDAKFVWVHQENWVIMLPSEF